MHGFVSLDDTNAGWDILTYKGIFDRERSLPCIRQPADPTDNCCKSS